jgi:hypothetical protein
MMFLMRRDLTTKLLEVAKTKIKINARKLVVIF